MLPTAGEKTRYRSQYHLAPKADHPYEPGLARSRKFQSQRQQARRLFWIKFVLVIGAMYALSSGGRRLFRSVCTMRYKSPTASLHRSSGGLPESFTLPSGDKIPSVALGTWQAAKGEIGLAVKTALEVGYRHFDGAWAYQNEEEVGKAIQESGIPRSEIWLTSKLWNTFHNPKDIEQVLDETLDKLRTSYIDLYLVHWPIAFKKERGPHGEFLIDHDLTEDPLPTWKKLEELHKKGKIRNIGVSNFNIRRLKNLTESDITIRPAVNQVELNYWIPQPELLKWSKDNNILLEAYSPLGGAKEVGDTLDLPVVKDIAEELEITPAEVLISWLVQRGVVVLPKSVHPSRIAENFRVTALPQHLFHRLENAAVTHPPHRTLDPSDSWGIDIFEDRF